MKRRGFLQLIGAATTAPFLPAPIARAAVAPAALTTSSVHAAILHAGARTSISRWGLMSQLGVGKVEADALMRELSRRGIIGSLNGASNGSPWARSKIANPAMVRGRTDPGKPAPKTHKDTATQPNIDLLMVHLHRISARYFAAQTA